MKKIESSIIAQLQDKIANEKLSKGFVIRAASLAEEEPEVAIPYLLDVIACGDENPQRRAAWICDWVSRDFPQLFEPYRQRLVDSLLDKAVGESAKRMILNTLLHMPIEDEIDGRLYSYCFDSMLSNSSALGFRSSAAKIVIARAQTIPELWQELQMVVSDAEGMDIAPSLRAVCRKVMKKKIIKRIKCFQKN